MDHRVQNVGLLHADALALYSDVVNGTADSIIKDLGAAIENLKSNWEGRDAGIQINNVVDVYNAMVKIRNALAELAKDSTTVAAQYRKIQNANRANLEDLAPASFVEERAPIGSYSDNRDTININPEALAGKTLLDNVNDRYDEFHAGVRSAYQKIMDNWQAGTGRDKAVAAFDDFMSSSNKYKGILVDVSASINDALKNYQL